MNTKQMLVAAVALALPAAAVPAHANPSAEVLARTEPEMQRPLRWLIAAQDPNGGWGAELKALPDVATTAISGIALIRLGHTVSAGEYHTSTRRAVDYVVRAVEKSPGGQIDVNPEGTLPQRKLGRHIDTFLAVQFLSEALAGMPQGKDRDRVRAALDSAVKKVQVAQGSDGAFERSGWAPVLSNAFASGGLFAARAAGAPVSASALERSDRYLMGNYDGERHQFKTETSAGVQLYVAAGTAQAAAREHAMSSDAAKAALARLSDENFLRGFGSYGGEEHVSYMMTSEALASLGGKDWERWDHGIRLRLAHIQRQDGTWRGDHCITSTSFCTAASLITLAIHPKQTKKPA
jgi:hypothetical protein